ncbi:hypothetical protein AAFX24_28380 [Vibrio mediterranei]|uniref:hypothetical protein n=1 Tax=Vibrio mediterranei TaxID=689 RepID=UPI0038CDE90E
MYIRKVSALAAIISLLVGCQSYKEIEETQSRIDEAVAKEHALIEKLKREQPRYRNISITRTLFTPPISEEEAAKPDWWFKPINTGTPSGVPLSSALSMVLSDDINITYGRNIDKGTRVSFRGATVGESIDSIASASGYSYKILANNKLAWSMYETRTFTVAAPPGVDYFGQGKGSGENNAKDNNIDSATEYANAKGDYDMLTQLYEELKTYSSFNRTISHTISSYRDIPAPTVDETGDVVDVSPKSEIETSDFIPIFLNRSSSTITVRDRPAVLNEMEKIVNHKNILFRTNVLLEIDIIEVKLTNEGAQALDVSAVISDIGRYGIGLESGVVAGNAASQIGRAATTLPTNVIKGEVTSGRLSGTEVLVEALSSYGTVATRTMPRQTLQHNSIAKLRDIENVYFIEERAATNTANVGTELSIKQDNLDVGFSLYVMPTVFKNDVTIRMATNLSSLLELTRNGDTGSQGEEGSSTYVESPRTSKKDFMSKFTVTAGDTLVLSGLSRELKTIRRGKGISEFIASSEFGKSERIETIITVTPRIYRPRS